jgi:hypothetical protein
LQSYFTEPNLKFTPLRQKCILDIAHVRLFVSFRSRMVNVGVDVIPHVAQNFEAAFGVEISFKGSLLLWRITVLNSPPLLVISIEVWPTAGNEAEANAVSPA